MSRQVSEYLCTFPHFEIQTSEQATLLSYLIFTKSAKILVSVAQKEKRLFMRASESEKTILAQAAQAQQIKISQFVLQASLDAAHAVLAVQTEFRLPPKQWEAFCQRLDAPPKAISELRHLFSEPEPF